MLKKYIPLIISIVLLCCSFSSYTQENNAKDTWKNLAKITFKKEYDEFLGFKVDVPVFSESVKEMDGKELYVEGYIIPVEGYKSQKEFVFSAFPYNMCFFCGGAGPETIMEVHATEPINYTVEKILIKGTLKLNYEGVNSFMYQLNDVTLVEK